jgi:hypothetical protein
MLGIVLVSIKSKLSTIASKISPTFANVKILPEATKRPPRMKIIVAMRK